MRDFVNLWRVYSLNDEAGTIICSWPKGGKPAIPLTYNSETMTGFDGHLPPRWPPRDRSEKH